MYVVTCTTGSKIAANGGLIVSTASRFRQPLDKPEIVAAMALAEQAGAVAIRIEGVACHACGGERADYWNCETIWRLRYASRPILKMLMRWRRRADINIDGTDRPRPVPVETLLARIHHHGLLAMTDCSTPEDGWHAKAGSRNYWHYAFWLYHA